MLRCPSFKLLHTIAVLMLALAPVACEENPTPKDPTSRVDPAEQARYKKSRTKIDGAKDALNVKNYDQARKLLREAAEIGVESHKFEIEQTAERIDKRQAKLWANEAHDLFEQKKCVEAFDQLAEQINGLESEAFTREVRKLTEAEAKTCANSVIDSMTMAGKFADARKFVKAKATVAVLGPSDAAAMEKTLDLVIVEALKGQISGEVGEKKWGEALAKVDAAVKTGNATDEIAAQVIATVRKAAAPDLATQAQRAIGTGDAAKHLASVDETIKLLRWEPTGADGTPAPKEKATPDELTMKRDALATWVQAQKLSIKMKTRAQKQFLHGKAALLPAMNVDGPSRRDIAPGTELWLLGTAKGRALVAEAEPDTFLLSAKFEKAIGWVPLDRLKKNPTAEWLPPNDQLKDVQVWGPFRPGDLLELGTVTEVKGQDITVKRITDGKESKHPRSKLRPAKIEVGIKLVGVCVKYPKKVVTIDEIVPPGRSVRFNCEGSEGIKEEVLENLRTKFEFLPDSK